MLIPYPTRPALRQFSHLASTMDTAHLSVSPERRGAILCEMFLCLYWANLTDGMGRSNLDWSDSSRGWSSDRHTAI